MNCMGDGMAKDVVWGLVGETLPKTRHASTAASSYICWRGQTSSGVCKRVRFLELKQSLKEVYKAAHSG